MKYDTSAPYATTCVIFREAQSWGGELYNAEPDKHAVLEWLDPLDLLDNVIPAGIFCLEQIDAGNHYAEYGWE